MTKGQFSSGTTSWIPLILIIIFVVFVAFFYTMQAMKFRAESMIPGYENEASGKIEQGANIRRTSMFLDQILEKRVNPGKTFEEWMRWSLYCEETGEDPCTFSSFTNDFETEVEEIISESPYRLRISYRSIDIVANRTSGSGNLVFGEGPAIYQTYVPVYGGDVVKMNLVVGGARGDMQWQGP